MDLIDLFSFVEYGFGWLFLVFTFSWGISGLILAWDDFSGKLINTLLIGGVIVYIVLYFSNSDFIEVFGLLIIGLLLLWLGASLSENVDEDWALVALVVGAIAFIAMFILIGMWI